ncbi:hypothetical protein OBBRIDRAFT_838326 [Obba rivulosa]|uniref:Uncharacterized protein n=1 Tax=Obba rivulosa TaxID=1052685 RepID=A0A8E2DGQ8_9APHY|nr:hypothetical protein OBBRIDRAFT_838326 [Obba rivulosa]
MRPYVTSIRDAFSCQTLRLVTLKSKRAQTEGPSPLRQPPLSRPVSVIIEPYDYLVLTTSSRFFMDPFYISDRELERFSDSANDETLNDDKPTRTQETFLTSLRNNIAKSQIGSLLVSYHASLRKDLAETFGDGGGQPHHERRTGGSRKRTFKSQNRLQKDPPSDSTPRCESRASRVSFILPTISRRSRTSRTGSIASSTSGSAALSASSASLHRPRSQTASSIAPSCSNASSVADSTPPLTPDSVYPSPTFSVSRPTHTWPSIALLECHEEGSTPIPPEKAELIKEGKKPQRPISYDALIDDISVGPAPTRDAQIDEDALDMLDTLTTVSSESEEWSGLKYAVELSLRERRASECDDPPVGEHSKLLFTGFRLSSTSRESWAAIHAGFVHPVFENEEYTRWRKWHHYLDRQAQKRRVQKALAYQRYADELATMYVQERRLREWIQWQNEELGDVAEMNYVNELAMLMQCRPDPYFPADKHGLGWVLKRSRSSACLRELHPIPAL